MTNSIKKYKKKGTYESIQKLYDQRNEKVLSYFKKHWKLNQEIVSKTEKELKSLKKEKSSDYAYVKLKHMTDVKRVKSKGGIPIRKIGGKGIPGTYRYSYYLFTMKLTDKSTTIGTVTSRGPVLNDIEYLFAINTLQYFIKFVSEGNKRKKLEDEINKNAPILKEKILLLPTYLTKVSVDKLKELYPYKVEIVDESKVIEQINNKNSGYAYVYVNHRFASCGTRFNHFVVDCGDNKPLLFDKRNSVSLGIGVQMSVYDDAATIKRLLNNEDGSPALFKQKFIKPKQIKKYVKIIEGK